MANTKFRYIITGNGCKTLVVHSDMSWLEFKQLIREQSELCHPEGHERVWRYGVIEFVNPRVHSVESFSEGSYMGAALIGVE